jgi:hypothetical protein
MKIGYRIAFVLTSVHTLAGCAVPPYYTAENLDARVIDAETKQPISGAIVVASWTLKGGAERGAIASLRVEEATTDEMGRFHIPGWGPLARPSNGFLDDLDPELVILKHGYFLAQKSNYNATIPAYTLVDKAVRTSNWNGRDIELERHKGDQNRYRNSFLGAFVSLNRFVYNSDDCKWKQMPKTVHAYEAERIYQRTVTGKPFDEVIPALSALLVRPQCQPTDEFLRAYNEVR